MAATVSGCPREMTLRGDLPDANGLPKPAVVDIAGEALPGVAVSVYGADRQAVTDGTGQYRISAPRGYHQIDFEKTGYAPARVVLDGVEGSSVDMPQTVMWPLPDSQGVYAFENGRYRSLTRVEPHRYLSGETTSVFGSKKGPESFIDPKKMPMLVVYRLPGFDLQLSSLHQVELTPAEAGAAAQGYKVPTWVTERRISMHTRPVDSPAGLLLELESDEPLPPGDYAIHWGAYDGFATTDARAYLFRVVPEAPPPGTEPEAAPAESADGDKKADKKKEASKDADKKKTEEKPKEKKKSE